jgi:hypothetical protein
MTLCCEKRAVPGTGQDEALRAIWRTFGVSHSASTTSSGPISKRTLYCHRPPTY